MRLVDLDIVVFDTETTGVDPDQARIVELGAVHVRALRPVTEWSTLVNPGVEIPAEATSVHGIDATAVAGAPTLAEVAASGAMAFFDRGPLVAGYNILGYDIRLLRAECARAGVPAPTSLDQALDVLVFARRAFRNARYRRLGDICYRFGYELVDAHGTLPDAHAVAYIMRGMVVEGIIPRDLEVALRDQAEYKAQQDQDNSQYSYWLYCDESVMYMACGKYIGWRVSDVPPDYVRYVLDHTESMPSTVEAVFRLRLS